jgi:two-component system sensor histidine kinase/response regulator
MIPNKQKIVWSQSTNPSRSKLFTHTNHVIRSRMDSIIEMTDLTLGTSLTKKQRKNLETVRISAHSLVTFLNDILDLSNIETCQLELEEINFDIRNTLENAVKELTVNAKAAGLELNWDIAPDVPTILMGDPGRIFQIIINLTQNAIRFTKEGKVAIGIKGEKKENARIVLHFVVSGIGTGIPQEQMADVFKRFTLVDGFPVQDHNGEDLGLSLSKQLVEMMGGRIWLESEMGHNSTLNFTVRLALSHGNIEDRLQLMEIDMSGLTALIVDDNEINRLVFQDMICSRGLVPTEAANGKEAIIKAKKAFKSGNPYQLLLLDLHMPGMDGFEVARKLKNEPCGSDMKIILLTSVGQKADTARCKELGISGYLLKPVEQRELLDVISISLGHTPGEKTPVVTRYTIQEARRRLKNPLTVKK